MIAEKNVKIGKAVGVLKELSQDERTRLLYEEREKAKRDEQARLEGAVEQKALLIAKNLLKKKMPVAEIAESTELSIEMVEELVKEIE